MFEPIFEPWMDIQEKFELVALSLRVLGATFDQTDAMIAEGISNGYSVDKQVELCKQHLGLIMVEHVKQEA